jgi:hypothetical protein
MGFAREIVLMIMNLIVLEHLSLFEKKDHLIWEVLIAEV